MSGVSEVALGPTGSASWTRLLLWHLSVSLLWWRIINGVRVPLVVVITHNSGNTRCDAGSEFPCP
eukprot:7866411-Prorocentrum_lima.AAC.1